MLKKILKNKYKIPEGPQLGVIGSPLIEELKQTFEQLKQIEKKLIETDGRSSEILKQIDTNLEFLKKQKERIDKNVVLKQKFQNILNKTDENELKSETSRLQNKLNELRLQLTELTGSEEDLIKTNKTNFDKLREKYNENLKKISKLNEEIKNLRENLEKMPAREQQTNSQSQNLEEKRRSELNKCNLKNEEIVIEFNKLRQEDAEKESIIYQEIEECMSNLKETRDEIQKITKNSEIKKQAYINTIKSILETFKQRLEEQYQLAKTEIAKLNAKLKTKEMISEIELQDLEKKKNILNEQISVLQNEINDTKGKMITDSIPIPDDLSESISNLIKEQERNLKYITQEQQKIKEENMLAEQKFKEDEKKRLLEETARNLQPKKRETVEPEPEPESASLELSDNIIDIDGLLKRESINVKKFSNEELQTEMKKVERGNQQLKNDIIEKLSNLSDNFEKSVSMISSDTEEPLLDNIKNSLAVKKMVVVKNQRMNYIIKLYLQKVVV